MVAVLCGCLVARSAAAGLPESVAPDSALDHGYSGLYNLDFAGAQKNFAAWEADHPDDPVGPVSEAAGNPLVMPTPPASDYLSGNGRVVQTRYCNTCLSEILE